MVPPKMENNRWSDQDTLRVAASIKKKMILMLRSQCCLKAACYKHFSQNCEEPILNFVTSVRASRPSARNDTIFRWSDFHKIGCSGIFKKSVTKIQISLTSNKITSTQYTCLYTFTIISRLIFHRTRIILNKICTESQETFNVK
jgi:hypothetical protein